MQRAEKSYFACANSCGGFVNYFSSVLQDMERIFILKGGPGTGKSTLMKRIGRYFADQGEPVEYIYCSSDVSSLDGVILGKKKIAVVDGTAPHVIEPKAPGACEEYVNLGATWNREKLIPYREEILDLQQKISHEFQKLYQVLRESKMVHDRWRSIYTERRLPEKLEQVLEQVKQEIFREVSPQGGRGKTKEGFCAALTPEGMTHYTETLTDCAKNRYFLKGAPGTGKSVLLAGLLERALELGIDAEVYRNPLEPEEIMMFLLPKADICVLDAMPPWEVFPFREGDVLVDMYSAVMDSFTEEENQETLSILRREYGELMQEAESHLARVRHLHDALEEYYIHAVDFNQIEQLTEDLLCMIE